MTLSPLDDLLDHFASDVPALTILNLKGGKSKARRRRSWTRWMDDMWLFGNDPSVMRSAQRELQDVARSIGLNINSGKTEVLEGIDVAERAMQIEHSAVDSALDAKQDQGPLEDLVDRLLEHPEIARPNQPSIRSNADARPWQFLQGAGTRTSRSADAARR